MRCAASSLLLVALLPSFLRADERPGKIAPYRDACVLLDIAFPCGRIILKQGRTVAYEAAVEPGRPKKKSGRVRNTTGTAPRTLTPEPVVPQPANDTFFPPPYFVTRTGKTFLTIEAGLGNYEVFIELDMPKGMPKINTTPFTDAQRKRLHPTKVKPPKLFKPTVRAVKEIVPNKLIPKLKP